MADDPKPMTMEERLAALEGELKAERDGRAQDKGRLDTYEATLRALGTDRQPPRETATRPGAPMNLNVPPPTAEQMGMLRSIYPGESDENISHYFRSAGLLFALHAQPLVNNVYGALGSAADALDLHNALLEVEDYKPNRKDVEAYIQESRQAGRQVTRVEATQIVKARKLPELVAAETDKRVKQEEERRAAAASATTETGSVTNARPNPAGGSAKPLAQMNAEERDTALAGMTAADRVKALETEIGDTPIP